MDIKLRAKLSAYSKVDSTQSAGTTIPLPDSSAAGSFLGINAKGEYTLIPTIKKENIDGMFVSNQLGLVTDEDIDSLFSNSNIDIEENLDSDLVSYDKIDSLF